MLQERKNIKSLLKLQTFWNKKMKWLLFGAEDCEEVLSSAS